MMHDYLLPGDPVSCQSSQSSQTSQAFRSFQSVRVPSLVISHEVSDVGVDCDEVIELALPLTLRRDV